MTLVDRNRRYVAVNDAAVDLYQRPREDIVGTRATGGMPETDPALADEMWARLMQVGELYGERVVRLSAGRSLLVTFAAHATKINGEWRALFMIVSAMREPEGEQLVSGLPGVGAGHPAAPRPSADSDGSGKRLTAREREIVQHVALGRSTPQIAADLNVSQATVRSHVRNAMVRTGAHTRAQLVAIALGNGRVG